MICSWLFTSFLCRKKKFTFSPPLLCCVYFWWIISNQGPIEKKTFERVTRHLLFNNWWKLFGVCSVVSSNQVWMYGLRASLAKGQSWPDESGWEPPNSHGSCPDGVTHITVDEFSNIHERRPTWKSTAKIPGKVSSYSLNESFRRYPTVSSTRSTSGIFPLLIGFFPIFNFVGLRGENSIRRLGNSKETSSFLFSSSWIWKSFGCRHLFRQLFQFIFCC